MLTGNTRYRVGFFGRIIVQVEQRWWGMPPHSRVVGWNATWRDASPLDLADLEVPKTRTVPRNPPPPAHNE